MSEPRKSARVTRGGLNAGDLSAVEGTGTSLVESRLTSSFDILSKRRWLVQPTDKFEQNENAANA